jgi:hypothetical protein
VHFRGKEDDPVEMWKLLEEAHLSKKPGTHFNAYDDPSIVEPSKSP